MNIVIAIDSFKGSFSSIEAGRIVEAAAKKIIPGVKTQVFPLADGGEGSVEALTTGLGGEIVTTEVTGPLKEKIASRYGWISSTKTAVIEMADVAGLTLVPVERRNPLNTTTYGLGELILHAVRRGCRNFIIGIGGSATNDCGVGMMTALGAVFRKADGSLAGYDGRAVGEIETIDISGLDSGIAKCCFQIACDVKNPLYGENGCSFIFGPQKGADREMVAVMDHDIRRFADKVGAQLGRGEPNHPGSGAAGGLGYAFEVFLSAKLEPGIDIVLSVIGIEAALGNADVVITGEGKLDVQTVMGKAPAGVARLAKRCQPKSRVIALCGCAAPEAEICNEYGIDAYFPILHLPMTIESAMHPATAERNLRQTAEQVFRLLC